MTKTLLPTLAIKFNRADIFLLFEILLLTLCVFTCSYLNSDGFLTPDSTSYLALANSLITGNGFYVSGYGYTGNEKDYFAIWPAGYPILIATIAKLTGINVFWSSKILNVLLATLSFMLLRKALGKFAYIYGLLFLSGASLAIFTYTWSETLFIFALIGFAIAMANTIENKNLTYSHILILSTFALILFSARYIGAFSIAMIGILGSGYLLTGNHKKAVPLIIASLICSSIVFFYLKTNHDLSGYLTGLPRIPAPESTTDFSLQLISAIASELVLPLPVLLPRMEVLIIILLQLFGFYFAFRHKKTWHKPHKIDIKTVVFTSIGGMYLIGIISMRYVTHFDNLSFRLMFPGTLLILIALLKHVETNDPQLFHKLTRPLLAMAFISTLLVCMFVALNKGQATYREHISGIQKTHQHIPSGSVIAFGNMHLKYLRPDLLLWTPWGLPYSGKKETWEHFLQRTAHKKIYLSKPALSNQQTYDESINHLLRHHQLTDLAEIR